MQKKIILFFLLCTYFLTGTSGVDKWLTKASKLLKKEYPHAELFIRKNTENQIMMEVSAETGTTTATIDLANSRSGQFPLMAVFDQEGRVKQIWILDYHEPYGFEVKDKNWLKRFWGKTDLMLSAPPHQVDTISGATISSRGVINKIMELSRLVREGTDGRTTQEISSD